MSDSLDPNLVPSAIIEFHAALELGKSESEAWAAAISRVRYDVLRVAIQLCDQAALEYDRASPEAAGCRACICAIGADLRD